MEVVFGHELETIGDNAFTECRLRSVTIPSVRTIGDGALIKCRQLTDVELPAVERIGVCAFDHSLLLQRIAIPY
jgi:hypothetical protein